MTKRLLQMFEENIFPFHDSCWLEKVGNQFVYLVALLAMAPKGVKKEPKDKTGADDLRKQQANMVTLSLLRALTLTSKECLLLTKLCQGSVTKKRNFCHCGQRTSLANGIPPGKKQFFLMRRRQ